MKRITVTRILVYDGPAAAVAHTMLTNAVQGILPVNPEFTITETIVIKQQYEVPEVPHA